MMFKQQIEDEDFLKQSEWLSGLIDQKSVQKKEQESESAKFLYDYDAVKNEIDAIEKRSYLKKRYVMQYRALKEREIIKRKKIDEQLAKQKAEFEVVNLKFKVNLHKQ